MNGSIAINVFKVNKRNTTRTSKDVVNNEKTNFVSGTEGACESRL